MPVAHYAVGSAVNQATRQIGSVLGVAITVVLIGHGAVDHADFQLVYAIHVALALLTAALSLSADLCLPEQRGRGLLVANVGKMIGIIKRDKTLRVLGRHEDGAGIFDAHHRIARGMQNQQRRP